MFIVSIWNTIPILICLSLIAVAAIDENKERPTLNELYPDLSSTNSHQDYPSENTPFSQMPFHLTLRVFDCMDAVSFIRSSVVCREWLFFAKQSSVFHTIKEILLGDNCPKSSDLLNVLRLLEARPRRYPILTEMFSKTESKRLVLLYDRIQSLPIPLSYCDTLIDLLVDIVNDEVVRQLFKGLRRHSQWWNSEERYVSTYLRTPKLDANFAPSIQDKLSKLVPERVLEPLYYLDCDNYEPHYYSDYDDIESLYDGDCGDIEPSYGSGDSELYSRAEYRFAERNIEHLLLSAEVLELLALCGVRIPLWYLIHYVPDISAEELEAILPFLTDFLYMNNFACTHECHCLAHQIETATMYRNAASVIFHLPVVVDRYRAHLDDLAYLDPSSLQMLIDLNVPFLQDLLHHRFGLIRDTLLHVLCKYNQIDTIISLASQYKEYVCEALITTNDNGLVPFYYLQWESISTLRQSCPEVVSLMFSSAPNAFVIRRLNIQLSEGNQWMSNKWHDLLLSELSDTDQKSVGKLLKISSRYIQQSDRLERLMSMDLEKNALWVQVLKTIQSETDADIRAALMMQLAVDSCVPRLVEVTSTNVDELYDIVEEAQTRHEFLQYANRDKLQVLLATASATTVNRPDPSTGLTALHIAFILHDYDLVTQALFVDGVDINGRDGHGTVPFQYASDELIWDLVRDLPKAMMESLVRSHPFTFLFAADRVLSKEDDYHCLRLLFENLHLFHICVSQWTASTSST